MIELLGYLPNAEHILDESCNCVTYQRPESLVEACWEVIRTKRLVCPKLEEGGLDFMVSGPLFSHHTVMAQAWEALRFCRSGVVWFVGVELLIEARYHGLQLLFPCTPAAVFMPKLVDPIAPSSVYGAGAIYKLQEIYSCKIFCI